MSRYRRIVVNERGGARYSRDLPFWLTTLSAIIATVTCGLALASVVYYLAHH